MLPYLSRSHHHTTSNGVKRIGSDTGTGGDSPTEHEGGQEVTLERTNQENRLDRIVHAKVQTTVDNDTEDGRTEATVETGNTIRSEGLLVDIDQTVELTLTTSLGVLVVVGETGTGVIQGVDEKEGSSTGSLAKLADTFANWTGELTPPDAKLPIIHLAYPSRSFLKANMDL